jgi:hypothetical protein
VAWNQGEEPTVLGDGKITRETDKAVKAELEDGREIWIPKSVIHDDSEAWDRENNEGTIVCKRWWMERNGYA